MSHKLYQRAKRQLHSCNCAYLALCLRYHWLKVRKFLCDRFLDHQITLEIFEFLYIPTNQLPDLRLPAVFTLQVRIVSHCLLFKVHISVIDFNRSPISVTPPRQRALFRRRSRRSSFYILTRCSCFVNHLFLLIFRRSGNSFAAGQLLYYNTVRCPHQPAPISINLYVSDLFVNLFFMLKHTCA